MSLTTESLAGGQSRAGLSHWREARGCVVWQHRAAGAESGMCDGGKAVYEK